MKKRLFRLVVPRVFRISTRIVFLSIILSLTFSNLWTFTPVQAACTVSGTVYQDYNADGDQDGREPGVVGITVTAYQTSVVPPLTPPLPIPSLTVGTATTVANGNYTMNVPTNGEIRIEFTDIPDGLESGRFGTGNASATTTTFVDCNIPVTTGVNLALSNPGEFCHIVNPQLATSCYVLNDQLTGPQATQPTFVAFPYDATGDPTAGVDDLIHQALANQTGSTWGLAYHRASDSFLVGAFTKRHAGFGPSILPATATTPTSTGAIYRITPGSFDNPSPAAIAANVDVTVFIDLGATTGADPHPPDNTTCTIPAGYTRTCWQFDTNTWPLVSKMGLGDVDITQDDKTLFAVNLFNRTLVEVPIIQSATGITAGTASPISLNGIMTASGCATNDWRPFGLGMRLGLLYLGAVCSAESTQDPDNLEAYVYRYDPLNPALGFTEVLRFPLDYPRRCADNAPGCNAGTRTADWQPWSDAWPAGPIAIRPEPLLSDIVFDGDNMLLGFRDRLGDRTGNEQPPPIAPGSSNNLFLGIAAGDVLRACFDATTLTYSLEDNASCGGITTAGANNTQGPDTTSIPVPVGGEYYWEDMNDPANDDRHDEITIGGMVDLPGNDNFAITVFDPLRPSGGDNGLFDGGVIWFNHDTGGRDQEFRIFNSTQGGPGNTFGKSNGLGDLEAVCGPPPLEIGNRVWEDLDRNGVQDPGEVPLGNVILQLYMISDSFGVPVNLLVGQTTTTADGEYYFNEANVFPGVLGVATPGINFWDTNLNTTREIHEPIGVLPRATYEVRLDNPANYGAGAPLEDYYITAATTSVYNDLNDTARDSDGRNTLPLQLVTDTNFPLVRLTTRDFGNNDHTYDFGFAVLPPPVLLTPPPPSGGCGLTVTKSVDKPFAAPGDKVIWTITVTNNCSSPITNVSIQDQLPDTLQILANEITVSSATGQVSVSGNTVTFTQPILNAGETVTITIPTIIDSNIPLPFIITNLVTGYNASAQVLSVSRLPNTGESPLSGLQLPILVLLSGLIVVVLVFMWRRGRRA